jgi:DNA repair exonuclease SbcCD ATPase subunit
MSLRIINLQAENYKGLKAIDITPRKNLVVLSGKNKQGKTAVLDGIFALFAGGAASRTTSNPIHDAEEQAWIRAEVGDSVTGAIQYVVTRRWTKNDAGTITVAAADGAKYSSPQKVLDEIIGKLSFDPLAFAGQDAKGQVNMLISSLGDALPFDPEELDRLRRGVFDTRTEVSRDVKKLEGQLAQYAEPTDDTPAEEVAIADLMHEAEEARAVNALIEESARGLASLRQAHTDALAAVKSANAALEAVKQLGIQASAAHDALPYPADFEAITQRMESIDAVNAKVRARKAREAIQAELSDRREQVAQHTIKLQEIDKTKADGIAAVKFPVEGLSFDTDGVIFNGHPFIDCSTSEQLRVSVAIGMAMNPELQVLCVDKGEALDSEALAVIEEMVDDRDFQLWMTKVDESGIGFVIEAGSLKAEVAA